MYRTHNCGELTVSDIGKKVELAGWVFHKRDLGAMIFIDLRDRYGITQLVFEKSLYEQSKTDIGREYVISVSGNVVERSNKNFKIPTGEIEIIVDSYHILNPSLPPPFTLENETDGGEELRMKYRYLDIRRNIIKKNIELRHNLAREVRNYLSDNGFWEIETPCLIKSTPEGARDFVVPSRTNPGKFYALPQSPQTFKQLLMIAGCDRYFQIVRCFRDEDLRADRQPEFTQIDCEMSFVTQNDVINMFEGLIRDIFIKIKGFDTGKFQKFSYDEAMNCYGTDKPDLRFEMKLTEITEKVKGKNFKVFDDAEYIAGISAKNCASYSRKQIDELVDFVKKPQIGASGLIYIKYENINNFKSSIDKYFTKDELQNICDEINSTVGDLIFIMAGEKEKTQKALGELRLEMGNRLQLRNNNTFVPLWVTDFPLLEWNETDKRFYAKHHPFTSPQDISVLKNDPAKAKANAYDLVINGIEIGGGSIRIHDKNIQKQMFEILGFSEEEANKQFGFLINAFEYGAPPHGGIAFGFDRLCAILGGSESIRDYIAFPKNNAGRDLMIESPAEISQQQLDELGICIKSNFK